LTTLFGTGIILQHKALPVLQTSLSIRTPLIIGDFMNFFYELLLTLHNLWRWIVLVLAILAVATACLGWFGKRPWTERDRKIGSFTVMGMDIQFLLGLLRIFGLSVP
jgi:uncharacterized membrane protein YozB (DUF420 family)